MTDEVEKLKLAAVLAAERRRQFDADVEEIKRVANQILHALPEDADIAAAALMTAFVVVAKGAEADERGVGSELMGYGIHHLMVEALEMGAGHG